MSTKVRRSFENQSVGVRHSEMLFNSMALSVAETGRVELTDNQLEMLRALSNTHGMTFKTNTSHRVITSGDHTVVKHQMITPQLPGSPVRESNRASEQMMKSQQIYNIMNYLLSKSNLELKACFLTFSFENADKGQLVAAEQLLNKIYKLLKHRMRWYVDWGNGKFQGTFPSMEVTINKKKLAKMDGRGLYHPHFHVVIFYTGEINMGQVYRQLWARFKKQCDKAGVRASAAAFLLEPTYDKNDGSDFVAYENGVKTKPRKRRNILSSVMEATKYETKPADWNMLAVTKKDDPERQNFNLDVWAEMYNAAVHPQLGKNCPYHGLKAKDVKRIRNNGSGLYQRAEQDYNAIVKSGFAGHLDFQFCNGDISRIPNYFVEAVTIDIKHIKKEKRHEVMKQQSSSGYQYGTTIAEISKMNPAERLHYNCSLLQKTLFLPGLAGFEKAIAKSNFGTSNKSAEIIDILKNMPRWNASEQDIIAVIDEWLETIFKTTDKDGNFNKAKAEDLQLIKEAYHYALTNEDYKRVRKVYRSYAMGDFKQDDEKNVELLENGHVLVYGVDFAVRKWKNLSLADTIANRAKDDAMIQTLVATGQLKAFYKKVLKGTANLRKVDRDDSDFWTIETVRHYVPLFVALTKGQKMKTETESRFSYPVNTWNFWTADSEAMNSKLTGLTPQLQLLIACLLYAYKPDEYKEAVLCVGSAARTVSLEVTEDEMKHAVNRLLKQNASNKNPLFAHSMLVA